MRRFVFERAEGHCEYRLIDDWYVPRPHEIDHIYAEKHRGASTEDNLCLSCFYCNRFKGSDMASLDPDTGQPTFLYHPRHDKWENHFRLEGARIEPLTVTGRATAAVLNFNTPERLSERAILLKAGRYP